MADTRIAHDLPRVRGHRDPGQVDVTPLARGAYRDGGELPTRDLAMDTLRGVLAGEITVQNHCYRADEMANIMDMAKEFGYRVSTFHHAVESYKIADLLKANNVCSAMWSLRM